MYIGEARPPRVCMRALPRNHRSRRTWSALVACGGAAGLLSPSSFNFSPVPTLNPTSTPSPTWYLTHQCHLALCIGAMPAWAALPAAAAAASKLFEMTTKLPLFTTSTASTAASPCAGSSPSPFSWTPVPSSLAAARPEEADLLERGAPNPHQLAAQVT
jgi:hypothetical protein